MKRRLFLTSSLVAFGGDPAEAWVRHGQGTNGTITTITANARTNLGF